MSDLISRKELIDYFYYGIDDKPIIDGISDRKIIDIIKNQPTAYSVEKVIEELEKKKGTYFDGITCEGTKIKINDAIEIVKQGSVSDDVCEWEYDKHFEFAKSECGSIDTHRIEFKKLKYCPYCGKKIKAVE